MQTATGINQEPTVVASTGVFSRIRNRLRNRPDSEHEMTLNRLVNNIVVLTYFAVASYLEVKEAEHVLAQTLVLFVAYNLASIALFLHILHRPGVSIPRRLLAMIMDLSMICYVMHVGDHATALLYPFILWTIFGNGFRFGRKYLLLATVVSLAEFGAVVATTEFWSAYPALTTGLMIGLIILPAYVSVLIHKLSEARDQAESANRAKSLFLASISHELRTPLTAIIGLSDVLRQTGLNIEQTDMNETISQAGNSLLALINSILDLSRLEVGKMPKQLQDVDIYRLMHRTYDLLKVPARAKGIHISLHIQNDVPRFVMASLKHIEDSIINLASNAVKFTERGFVTISVLHVSNTEHSHTLRFEVSDSGIGISPEAQSRIFERFTQADETIVNKFGGTGLGLATVKQMIEDIDGSVAVTSSVGKGSVFWFDVTFASSANVKLQDRKLHDVILLSTDMKLHSKIEEAGIDAVTVGTLSECCDKIAEMRGAKSHDLVTFVDFRDVGSDIELIVSQLSNDKKAAMPKLIIVADNTESLDTGIIRQYASTVLVRPLEMASIENALVIASGPRSNHDSVLESENSLESIIPRRILLADDNKTNQKVITKILERAGHRVTVVDNGQTALATMQEFAFDIAFLDVNMPVLSGVEAAKLYRFTTAGSDCVPIVALTADATAETRKQCLEAGMVECLLKPIEPQVLLGAVSRITDANPIVNLSVGESTRVEAAAPMSQIDFIDMHAVNDLIELGGKEFALDIVLQFAADGNKVMLELVQAVATGNAAHFADQVHALRSGAANVGAQQVFKMCQTWRQVSSAELNENGEVYLREFSREFEFAVLELQKMLLNVENIRSEKETAAREPYDPKNSRAA